MPLSLLNEGMPLIKGTVLQKRNPRRQNGHQRNKLRNYLKQKGDPCGICGQPIDYSLPPGEPLSFEVDEIIPVSRWKEFGYSSAKACALDPKNVQASHRICNQRKSNKIVEQKSFSKPLTLPKSRIW